MASECDRTLFLCCTGVHAIALDMEIGNISRSSAAWYRYLTTIDLYTLPGHIAFLTAL